MQEHIGPLLTTEEVAAMLHVHVKTVREWIATGELSAIDLGQAYRVNERDLLAFLDSRKQPRPRRKKREQHKSQFRPNSTRLLPLREGQQAPTREETR